MRRAMAGLLTGSLLLAMTSCAEAPPSPSPEVAGHRIEMAESGVAITLPADWTHRIPNVRQAEMLLDLEYGELGGSDFEPSGLLQAWGPGWDHVYLDLSTSCLLETYWTATPYPLSEWIGDERDAYLAYGSDEPPVTLVDLPAARVARLDDAWTDDVLGVTWAASRYLYGRGTVQHRLTCLTPDTPPEDRWLSIAETIEFLPVEE